MKFRKIAVIALSLGLAGGAYALDNDMDSEHSDSTIQEQQDSSSFEEDLNQSEDAVEDSVQEQQEMIDDSVEDPSLDDSSYEEPQRQTEDEGYFSDQPEDSSGY